jgi:hypothetical protein
MGHKPEKRATIPAECHSDDHIVEAEFDALPWFKQASDKEIIDLAKVEWGGDYEADDVADFCRNESWDVAAMFNYLDTVAGTDKAVGFECHVVEAAAMAWLQVNRPTVHQKILEISGE